MNVGLRKSKRKMTEGTLRKNREFVSFANAILNQQKEVMLPRLDWTALRKLHGIGVGLHAASPAQFAALPVARGVGRESSEDNCQIDPLSFCTFCGEQATKLSMCTACRKVKYCSRTCQIVDWKFGKHRQVCQGKKSKKNKKKKPE